MNKNYTINYDPEWDGCVINTQVLSASGEPLYMDDRSRSYTSLEKALLTVLDGSVIDTGVMENTSIVFIEEADIPKVVEALSKAKFTRIMPSNY